MSVISQKYLKRQIKKETKIVRNVSLGVLREMEELEDGALERKVVALDAKEIASNGKVGIYESIKAYEGVLFKLEDHLDRFFESGKTVGLKIPETRGEIRRRIEKALAESGKKDAFVRLTLIDNVGATHASPLLSVIIAERTHSPELYRKGIVLKTSAVTRNTSASSFPEAKTTSGCLNQVLATLDPAPPGTYEILLLNQEGDLTEVRIGIFFIVKNGALFTPAPRGLLDGVTRRFVIKCARLGKIPFEERPLTRHELFNADEAFLTNTSWEILPIREVDGRRIGGRIPGPVTQKLQKLFRREVEKEISATRRGARLPAREESAKFFGGQNQKL